jgi:hypothetical protein
MIVCICSTVVDGTSIGSASFGLNDAGHDEGKRDKSCHADHDQPLGPQDLLTHRRSHGDSFSGTLVRYSIGRWRHNETLHI